MRTNILISRLSVLLAAAVMAGCEAGLDVAGGNELVVEGWIDSGGFPVVMLTRTVAVGSDYRPTSSLNDCVEQWARVAVSDGEREVVLIGHRDDDYFPPYVYTTTDMRGVAGRTYSLTVDCIDGTHAEASATIPHPVAIDSLTVEPVAVADTLRQVYAFFDNSAAAGGYYKLFTRVLGHEYGYLSACLGIASADMLQSDGRMAVSQGRQNMTSDFTPYFAVGDTVMVKLARVDSTAYAFWRDFDDMVTLSRNPFFPVTNNLHSNVRGGLGYWFGYGASFGSVIVRP